MLKINGEKFKIYTRDNQETIKARIASNLKTLPKYLYFPEGDTLDANRNNVVKDLFNDDIMKIEDDSEEPLRNLIDKSRLILPSNEITNYVIAPVIENILKHTKIPKDFICLLISDLLDIDCSKIDYKRATEAIKSEIKKNSKEVEKFVKKYEKIDVVVGVEYTDFDLESLNVTLRIDFGDVDLVDIFNMIKLNSSFPFASYNDFYKVLNGVDEKERLLSSENAIIITAVSDDKIKPKSKSSKFIDIILALDKDSIGIVSFIITTNSFENISEFKNNFLNLFNHTEKECRILSTEYTKIVGVFYFPDFEINQYVLSDLIMNNDTFSSVMSIDEHEKVTKEKSNLYIHYKDDVLGTLNINLTNSADDPKRVRIKINSLSSKDTSKAVYDFQNKFSQYMSVYIDEYDNIVQYYKTYLPRFGETKKPRTKTTEKKSLRAIAPEVFVSNYSRHCSKLPTIIDDNKVKDYENDGYSVMKFPDNEINEVKSRYYICDYEDAPYPGLFPNQLPNNNILPQLPCCYKKRNIIDESAPTQKQTQQQYYIKTHKFVQRNYFANLPENMDRLFNLFDDNESFSFSRKGVSNTKRSFLECVLEATEKLLVQESVSIDESINNFMKKEIEKLSSHSVLCRQEMYDYSTEQIRKLILNDTYYFKPEYFIHLIETIYDCDVYVFNRKDSEKDAELILPRFVQGYYTGKRHKKSILIYQHMGSESGYATEPRCELIVRNNTLDDNLEYIFEPTDPIINGVRKIFNQLKETYIFNKIIKDVYFKTPKMLKIGQRIDVYGKSRMLRIKYKDNVIDIETTPIQPFDCKELINDNTVNRVTKKTAYDLYKVLGCTEIELKDGGKYLIGLAGTVNIRVEIANNKDSDSVLDKYNKMKRTTRYVLSYLYWLYSRFLVEKSKNISQESMDEFCKEYVVVDPDFDYGDIVIDKKFSLDSPIIQNRKKLIVKSEDIIKRLVFSLLNFSRQTEKMIDYHNEKEIEDYYLDLTDFVQYNGQTIIKGSDTFNQWLFYEKPEYKLHDTIPFESKEPYFFKNKLIAENRVCLAQNTTTLRDAIDINKKWVNEGYNKGSDTKNSSKIDEKIIVYFYTDKNNIVKHVFNEDIYKKNTPIIVSYRVKGELRYTALLEK